MLSSAERSGLVTKVEPAGVTARAPSGLPVGLGSLSETGRGDPESGTPSTATAFQRNPFLRLLFGARRTPTTPSRACHLETRRQAVCRAIEDWRSLLVEMEREGQSGDLAYERYFGAYLAACRQRKQIELELFNLRQGHIPDAS